jgi:hypothetical protein
VEVGARSRGATGAGARGLNLPEAKGRNECAAPTLPVWPGPYPPPPLVANGIRPMCRRREFRRRALDDDLPPGTLSTARLAERLRQSRRFRGFPSTDRRNSFSIQWSRNGQGLIARRLISSRATFSIRRILSFAPTVFAGLIQKWRAWSWRRLLQRKYSAPTGRSR